MAIGLDAFGISFLARELGELIGGLTIETARLGEDRSLTIGLRDDKPLDLRFLLEPSLPLLCVAQAGQPPPRAPHLARFEDPLRGCTIADVSQIGLDRVIMITAARKGHGILRLYFELVPPFPNVFLTDGQDTVRAILFRAGTHTRRRTLERGKAYAPPPAPDKVHPVDITPSLMESLKWQEDPEILSRTILGVSPFVSREVAERAAKKGGPLETFTDLIDYYREGRVTAYVFQVSPHLSKNPPHMGLAWFRPTLSGIAGLKAIKTFNAAVALLMSEFLQTTKLEKQRGALLRNLSREIHKWEKIRDKAEESKRKREEAAELRRFGEIIIANLARIKKGASRVELPDIYSAEGKKVLIPLEPGLSPQANADRLFKIAKKAFRRADRVEERLQLAQARLQELYTIQAELASPAVSEESITKAGDLVSDTGMAPAEEKAPGDERAARLGIKPRRYVVTGGWTVLVGKSAKENDILTHKYASPSDLWFHARQAQGSHVVLRRDKPKAQVHKQAILEAARIAAYYSKARTSKTVPVSYTEKRYVKKVRKGPPGLAAMLREKVVFVEPRLPQ